MVLIWLEPKDDIQVCVARSCRPTSDWCIAQINVTLLQNAWHMPFAFWACILAIAWYFNQILFYVTLNYTTLLKTALHYVIEWSQLRASDSKLYVHGRSSRIKSVCLYVRIVLILPSYRKCIAIKVVFLLYLRYMGSALTQRTSIEISGFVF